MRVQCFDIMPSTPSESLCGVTLEKDYIFEEASKTHDSVSADIYCKLILNRKQNIEIVHFTTNKKQLILNAVKWVI